MVLVDSSVWIDHIRKKDDVLSQLLINGQVCMHPMIVGELACGNLRNRLSIIKLWQSLPHANHATHQEALHCLEKHSLFGKGIGFIDLHLLASTLLSTNTFLWTNDRRLKNLADDLKLSFSFH
ncbi:type II toxin-antitoxin system VapC family toxin [Paraglaciecola sp. MB-3u-78]|uniref:type II toxin-antitoxin system VapC family toxin n=1 Tax=Paraglaciecola sp. MB-3u-78 TaxID=2058332 RepID=UPI000C339D4C|nr:type II toxin-antitoxin system VapC family toxin [Paraglaciecola sp. MB-3u-78]PKG99341.1 VapC toxin family PIN domain ribonuclease [Paraglaciecola sp. MB-3u-78]